MLAAIPFRRVGNRASLFMGGDRELVMFTGLLAFALIFSAQDWVASGFGLVMWVSLLWVWRALARRDPLMRSVYMRHRRYARHYAPRATPFRDNRRSYK